MKSYSKTTKFSCSLPLNLLIFQLTCFHNITFSILIALLYCSLLLGFQAKLYPYRKIAFLSYQEKNSYPLPALISKCLLTVVCEPFSGIKHCLSVLWQLYVELKDRLGRFSSNTSDFRAKYVKAVELQCIYLVLESTSKLKLNHDVLIVIISGLTRFQVPSNIF